MNAEMQVSPFGTRRRDDTTQLCLSWDLALCPGKMLGIAWVLGNSGSRGRRGRESA